MHLVFCGRSVTLKFNYFCWLQDGNGADRSATRYCCVTKFLLTPRIVCWDQGEHFGHHWVCLNTLICGTSKVRSCWCQNWCVANRKHLLYRAFILKQLKFLRELAGKYNTVFITYSRLWFQRFPSFWLTEGASGRAVVRKRHADRQNFCHFLRRLWKTRLQLGLRSWCSDMKHVRNLKVIM